MPKSTPPKNETQSRMDPKDAQWLAEFLLDAGPITLNVNPVAVKRGVLPGGLIQRIAAIKKRNSELKDLKVSKSGKGGGDAVVQGVGNGDVKMRGKSKDGRKSENGKTSKVVTRGSGMNQNDIGDEDEDEDNVPEDVQAVTVEKDGKAETKAEGKRLKMMVDVARVVPFTPAVTALDSVVVQKLQSSIGLKRNAFLDKLISEAGKDIVIGQKRKREDSLNGTDHEEFSDGDAVKPGSERDEAMPAKKQKVQGFKRAGEASNHEQTEFIAGEDNILPGDAIEPDLASVQLEQSTEDGVNLQTDTDTAICDIREPYLLPWQSYETDVSVAKDPNLGRVLSDEEVREKKAGVTMSVL